MSVRVIGQAGLKVTVVSYRDQMDQQEHIENGSNLIPANENSQRCTKINFTISDHGQTKTRR